MSMLSPEVLFFFFFFCKFRTAICHPALGTVTTAFIAMQILRAGFEEKLSKMQSVKLTIVILVKDRTSFFITVL